MTLFTFISEEPTLTESFPSVFFGFPQMFASCMLAELESVSAGDELVVKINRDYDALEFEVVFCRDASTADPIE